MKSQNRSHAIVMGGSIAGLCAARALSKSFERVTLIERDRLPAGPEHRPGVPQSHHIHALLLRGLLEFEKLFPGIEQDLTAAGASRLDLGNDFAHCTEWGWALRAPTHVRPLMLSRRLLECGIRARARSDASNVTWIEETRVTGLLTEREGDRIRVTGITTSRDDLRELSADLVVDAMGRSSKSLEWFAALGVTPPEEEVVDSFAGYASRFYELAPNPDRWWRGMLVDYKVPSCPRWALMLPVEHNRVVLTIGGMNGLYPPTDEQGYDAYLKELLTPALAIEMSRATPVTGIRSYRALYNRARRFERWRQDVAGFLSLGDSAMVFNPYHGQGMSMAGASANLLGELCASSFSKTDGYAFTRRFHRKQAKLLETAWKYATSIDMEWPGTQGKRPFGFWLYFKSGVAVLRASHEFPTTVKRWIGPLYQLTTSPYSLLKPWIWIAVAYAELRRLLGGRNLLPSEQDSSYVTPWTEPLVKGESAVLSAE